MLLGNGPTGGPCAAGAECADPMSTVPDTSDDASASAARSVLLALGRFLAPRPARKPVYKDVSVSLGDVKVVISTTGGVVPQNRVELKPPVPGRIGWFEGRLDDLAQRRADGRHASGDGAALL